MQNTGLNKYDWITAGLTAGIGLLSAVGGILTVIFGSKATQMRQTPIKK